MTPFRSTGAVLLACGMALAAWTQVATAVSLGEQRITSTRAVATGTVTAIDASARTLTVKSPRGTATYRADTRKVKDLESFKVGDVVRVDYVTRLGVTLRRNGNAPAEAANPAASDRAIGARTTMVTRVLGVDRSRSTIKLKGPQGHVQDFVIADKADLAGVKVGDEVEIVLYELAAVGVAPAKR